MSGRPTTRRSTSWPRLLLVFALVTAIALPSLAGRLGLSSALDPERISTATASKALDDTTTLVSTVRAERQFLIVLAVGVALIGATAPRRRRTVPPPVAMPSSALVLGGVGLRAPPVSSRA